MTARQPDSRMAASSMPGGLALMERSPAEQRRLSTRHLLVNRGKETQRRNEERILGCLHPFLDGEGQHLPPNLEGAIDTS